jgi:DNA-binding MarR family transcriptional regulator
MAQKKSRSGPGRDTAPQAHAVRSDAELARGVSRSATIRDLLAYRVHVVANTISRSAATRFRRDFDVTLGEWRCIALLARFAPLGLNQLARQSGVDRGQISRIVAGLTRRRLVSRTPMVKGKPINLVLTTKGRGLYDGLFAAAIDRDEIFLGALTEKERADFDRMLNKILGVARQVERNEREKSATRTERKSGRQSRVDFTTPVG